MKTGTTKSGFQFKIDEQKLNDMEFLDALAGAQEDGLQFSKVCTMMLGEEQKKRLYDHLRNEEGRVPIEDMQETIIEIMSNSGDEIKNS